MPYGQATLSWAQNGEADLAGYKLYYGTAPGVYTFWVDVGLTATPSAPSYTMTDLSRYGLIYFAVTAYDTATPPNESGVSNEVSRALAPKMFPRIWP